MTSVQPIVNRIKCHGCQQCIDVCDYDMFELDRGKVRVDYHHMCHACMECVDNCTFGAIKIIDLKTNDL